MANILIIGCGAIGTALARQLVEQGHNVTAIKRQPPATHDNAIHYIAADISNADDLVVVPCDFEQLFFIVSADGRDEASYRAVYQRGVANVLQRFPAPCIFVSSTSVYGQNQGEWVDEQSPAEPQSPTARWIRHAEQQITDHNSSNIVVRFSGIYGRGREYLLRLAKQTPSIQRQPPYYTNRIRQEDSVAVLAFLFAQRLVGVPLAQYYLASDDDPAPIWEVMSWLAQQLACAPPVEKIVENTSERNKRCSNQRLKALGYRFRYASYREGYGELV